MDWSQVSVFRERIAQRSFVVHEKADRLGFQLVQIEARGETDLNGQVVMLLARHGAQGLGLGVVPFLNAAFGAEPRGMVLRVVGREVKTFVSDKRSC